MDPETEDPASHHPRKDATAADAEFLDQVADASVLHLHRSNLLRLQMEQVIDECTLNLNVQDANHVQWAPTAHGYLRHVAQLVEKATTGGLKLSPSSDAPFSFKSDRASQKALSVTLAKPLETILPTHFHNVSTPGGNANVLPTLPFVVLLPPAIFDPKDYARHRYFDKRNLIVWHLAKFLSTQKGIGRVYWEYQQGDSRKPILLLVPPTAADGESKKQQKKKKQKLTVTKKLRFRVQVFFQMESLDWMASPLRMLPNRCNLKIKESKDGDKSDKVLPSQHYNHALLEDAHQFSSTNIIDEEREFPDLAASLLLAKIWCLKRGLLRNHDGWTADHIALLFLYLYRTKRANARMAPPQVLAAWFKLLAQTNWLGENEEAQALPLLRKAPIGESHHEKIERHRDVLVMPSDDGNESTNGHRLAQLYADEHRSSKKSKDASNSRDEPSTLLGFYQSSLHYQLGPVFLDPTLTFNYFGRMSPSFIRSVQREAEKSLDCLHSDQVQNPFDYLLRTNARFWDRYDAYLQIPINAIDFGLSKLWRKTDAGGYESISRGLVEVLRMALGDRVRAIRLLSTGNGNVLAKSTMDATNDSDAIIRHMVTKNKSEKLSRASVSPTGSDMFVLGVSIDPDTCFRLIDRGPPADDSEASKAFLDLWGNEKAELRRFKDGAIVHAVVWGSSGADADDVKNDHKYIQFQNDMTFQGGIVERIIRHTLKVHFLRRTKSTNVPSLQFSLREMVSTVDAVIDPESPEQSAQWNPTAAHRMAMKAFDELSQFLRKYSQPTVPVPGTTDFKSRLHVPLAIDAVEALGPALRYVELYPPLPHPLLGGKNSIVGSKRVTGAVQSEPIKIQIRFGSSSKWPGDLTAIGASKTAMLIQLAKGIESIAQSGIYPERFDGPIVVTPSYADIGFMGYVFRIYVRADPELRLLQGLKDPSREAAEKLRSLTKRHVVAASHHSMVHAVYTSQPSSSAVVRMAKKWMSSHLLSGLIPFEVMELLVCHVYTERSSPLGVPGSVVRGFLNFLFLLANHDWEREPLIVDPQAQVTEEERRLVNESFEKIRGTEYKNGPAMYVVSPNDLKVEGGMNWFGEPSFGSSCPEVVVLRRACALARKTFDFLKRELTTVGHGTTKTSWSTAFQETPASFRSYSALLRVDPEMVVDDESSSTASSHGVQPSRTGNGTGMVSSYMRSMKCLLEGPKSLRIKLYRNLMEQQNSKSSMLLEWRPVQQLVQTLRHQLGDLAIFFYNDLCPDVIGVLWRPTSPRPFSAMNSEFARPVVQHLWKADTMVTRNVRDVMREMRQYTSNIVIDIKVFDGGPKIEALATSTERSASKKRKSPVSKQEESDSDGQSGNS